jgi:hypothetical protein
MVIKRHKPDPEALLREEQRIKAMVDSYYQTLRETTLSLGGNPQTDVPTYKIRKALLRQRKPGQRKSGWAFNDGVWELIGTEYVVWKTTFKAGGVYFWSVASVGDHGEMHVLTGSSVNADGKKEKVVVPNHRAAMDWVNTFILGLRSRYERYGLDRKAKARSAQRQQATLDRSWFRSPSPDDVPF